MENEMTREWLVKETFSYYRKKTGFDTKVVIVTMTVAIAIFYFVGYGTGMLNPKTSLSDPISFAVILFLSFLPYIVFELFGMKIIMQRVGNLKKWQERYVQSRVDDFKEYDKQLGTLIKEIEGQARQEIEALKINWESMKETTEWAQKFVSSEE